MLCPAATGIGRGKQKCKMYKDQAHRCVKKSWHPTRKPADYDHICLCGYEWQTWFSTAEQGAFAAEAG